MAKAREARSWRIVDVAMIAAFLFSIVVQLNDPDPLVWVAIYALAGTATLVGLFGRGHWAFPAIVGIVALAWAMSIAPRVVGRVPFLDMFGAFEMANVGIEESREMYGLLLIGAWMAVLTARWARQARAVNGP